MKSNFKVAMIAACPFPSPRGTPIRILRLAEGLSQRGHEVHVLTYHLGEEPENQSFRIHRIQNVRTYQKISPGPSYQKLMVLDPLLAIKLSIFLQHSLFMDFKGLVQDGREPGQFFIGAV